MTRLIKAALVAASFVISGSAGIAATVIYDPGTNFAVGIDDLDVNGTNLYVRFHYGSFDTVYGATLPWFWGDESSASDTADEIATVLNAEASVPQIAWGTSEILWIPTANSGLQPNNFEAEQVGHNTDNAPWQRFGDFVGDKSTDYTGPPTSWLFTRISDQYLPIPVPPQSPPPIPLPASISLLGVGLLGIAGLSRRRRKIA